MARHLVPLPVCVLAVLLLVALAPAAVAGPFAARTDTRYVALGDSYAAGVGATPDPSTGDCRRSDRSYPALWAARHAPASFTSVACSGATSGEVVAKQVRAVARDTTLVTITAGGNDTGFGPVLATCSTAPDDEACFRAIRGGERAARFVAPGGLISTIVGVRLQAPDAEILVLGYPRLFEPGTACDVPGAPNAARREALNRAADTLNASLADAAQRFRGQFVDVRDTFAGHGVCSADPWINPPAQPTTPAVYHPNERGYTDGYLPAFTAAAARP
ncbi:SGNH/GDSL hydrolase family protein [Pseudonocardia nantongensis]|uniref:SGNH/GDSL hydrolase family protein n=1 Tax=Pseudonocardia nantongensis TaxID=1181885 RepID=UPI00397DE4AF